MKHYILEIEETDQTNKSVLMQIIKALAEKGIIVKSAGLQQLTEINSRKGNHE